MEKISEHITYDEATISPTGLRLGIENIPTPEDLERMKAVANACFEPLRSWYGKPIKVNSFYRCPILNKAVGGAPTSQHANGEAIDMSAGSKEENKKIFEWCKANLIFDQLIYEYGDETGPAWVHISFRKGNNRNQTLIIK